MNTLVVSNQNTPFFLDFAVVIPEHIQLESVVSGRECIVYDGPTAKSVDD